MRFISTSDYFDPFFDGMQESRNNSRLFDFLCAYNPISVNVKYVDKNSNASLFSGNSAYTLGDLKVTPGAIQPTLLNLSLPPSIPAVIVIKHLGWGELLTLGNLPADKITITTRKLGKECCSGFEVSSLKINDEMICRPCNDLNTRVLIIKK